MSETLKTKISQIADLINKLYEYYVPPFTINTVELTENEVQNIIKDLKAKGGLRGWLRLDGIYYTTDLETFKRIIEWDWTDTRKYLDDVFDCDKFAMYFKSRMAIDFHINAIGIVLDNSSEHAYNLVILKDAQGVKYYLYEPQKDSIFTYENRDIRFYRMAYYYLLM